MLWTFNRVPSWPDGGRREAMSFRDIERPQCMMRSASLRGVLGAHAINHRDSASCGLQEVDTVVSQRAPPEVA